MDLEPIGTPDVYGQDRVFAYLRCAEDDTTQLDAKVHALAAAGQLPSSRITLPRRAAIGQEFFRWEIATAVAGAVIGIDPLRPARRAEASKIKTRALTDAYEKNRQAAAGNAHRRRRRPGLLRRCGAGRRRHRGRRAARAPGPAWARATMPPCWPMSRATPRTSGRSPTWRMAVRDRYKVATVGGFGPRFLHSTGQAYKGGPNSGVFLQITADPARDLSVPGRKISFGTVQAAQALGDLQVLAERGRRYLRVHLRGGDVESGLARLAKAVKR